MASNQDGLFFFHNPKAGGTAIARMLSGMFPPETHCPLIENTQREHEARAGAYDAFRGFRFYGGHYGRDIFDAVADGHRCVTNFREPAARLLSLYNFYRMDVVVPDDPVAADALFPVTVAQTTSFHEFVSCNDPRVEIHTRNHHVRQLSRSGWDPDHAGNLPQATALVGRMPWFYVCEHPALSEAWGHAVFGHDHRPLARANVTSRVRADRVAVTTIEPRTRKVVADKNQLDQALYELATRRLLRRETRRRWFEIRLPMAGLHAPTQARPGAR